MKKSYKVIQYVNTGIFPGAVLFSCGFNYEELTKELKKQKCNEWLLGISTESDKDLLNDGNYFALRRTIRMKGNKVDTVLFYIILIKQFTFTDDEYAILAHECLHICQYLLPPILNRDREYEAEAYLHTHLMKQCLKHLRGKDA